MSETDELTISFLVLEEEKFGVKSYGEKDVTGYYIGTNYWMKIGDNKYTGHDENLDENMKDLILGNISILGGDKTYEDDYKTVFDDNHNAILSHLNIERDVGDTLLEYFLLDTGKPNSYSKHLTKSINDQIDYYESKLEKYWVVRRKVQYNKGNNSIKISVGELLSGKKGRPASLKKGKKFTGRVYIDRSFGRIAFIVDTTDHHNFLDNYSIKLIPEKQRVNGTIQVAVGKLFSNTKRFIQDPEILSQDIILGDFMISDNSIYLDLDDPE